MPATKRLVAIVLFPARFSRPEGVGAGPDIEVRDTLPYANGRDPQLERALEVAADR